MRSKHPDLALLAPAVPPGATLAQYLSAHHTFLERCQLLLRAAAQPEPSEEEEACLRRHGFKSWILTDGEGDGQHARCAACSGMLWRWRAASPCGQSDPVFGPCGGPASRTPALS